MVIIDNLKLLAEFKALVSNGLIQILIWIVIGDIATGIIKGFYTKDSNSTKGLLGIVKHMLVVILIVVAYPYLKILGLEMVANSFVFAYVVVYLISITENLGQIGIWVPAWIKNRLAKLKDEADEKPLNISKKDLAELLKEVEKEDDK